MKQPIPSARCLRDGLAPGFVVAMPQLVDPNFHRTVVLLLKSDDEGAFGLVINRRTNVSVRDLCRTQGIDFNGPSDLPLFLGGPVEVERHLLVLHGEDPIFPLREPAPAGEEGAAGQHITNGDERPQASPADEDASDGGEDDEDPEVEIIPGLFLITATEGLAALAERGATRLRCYAGYAGWGAGQLEQELEEGAWIPLAANPHLVFAGRPEESWERALRDAGIDPITLVPGGPPS